MKILITGGAGCLGSNLAEHYYSKGHQICIIDNFSTGRKGIFETLENLKLIEGSVSDEDLVNKVFNDFRPSHVIHCAASYKDPNNWTEDVLTNVLGSINVVNASAKFEVQRFINFQTALCYGNPNYSPISITHPTAPFTSYGISKTAGESYLSLSQLSFVSLRLANICGPRLAIGPIPTFYMRLKEGKSCFCTEAIRDFLDMQDFIDLIDIVIDVDADTGIFNVSTGEGHSIFSIFNVIAEYLKKPNLEVPIIPIGEDDVREVVLDPSVTMETFGWKAKVPFKQTIHNQLQWYDQFGIDSVFSHLKKK